MSVPFFKKCYFPEKAMLDNKQLEFYNKLDASLSQGQYIDVESNIGYLFIYLYGVVEKCNNTKTYKLLSDHLTYLAEIYSLETKFSNYCTSIANDCLIVACKYSDYLNRTEPTKFYGTATHFHNFRLNLQYILGIKANPLDILLMFHSRKTKVVVENPALYKEKVFEVFNNYSIENGSWFEILFKWMKSKETYSYDLFSGIPVYAPVNELQLHSFYHTGSTPEEIKESDSQHIKLLAKEAENLVRKDLKLPLIGEGWISETALFYKVRDSFPETKVIQHAHPSWLGRQHFDIWIPNWNIAIEYHGKQHFEPVEFFGGKKAFKKTVERDQRKMKLAAKHNTKLFIITEKDNQDNLICQIKEIANNRSVKAPDMFH